MASDGREYFEDRYYATGYWNGNWWYDASVPPPATAGATVLPSMPAIIRAIANLRSGV